MSKKQRISPPTRYYPVLTMLGQSLGSLYVVIECLLAFTPDVYCDTTGAAFTYPLARFICGCHVIAYVHYPIIRYPIHLLF